MTLSLGTVASEGGPLLICDSAVARTWCGASEDERDYVLAVSAIAERSLASIGRAAGRALVWDVPAGLVRVSEEQGDLLLRAGGRGEVGEDTIDEPIFVEGLLIVAWAAEDLRNLVLVREIPMRYDVSVGGSAMSVPLAGTFGAKSNLFGHDRTLVLRRQ
jgi:hypothetical protein